MSYYEERGNRVGSAPPPLGALQRRPAEASRVPPEWHAWLHYTTDAPLPDDGRRAWQKPHQANMTGTPARVSSFRARLLRAAKGRAPAATTKPGPRR